VKTGVSLPDDLFALVSASAARQGLSRSAVISTAVAEYLHRQQTDEVTVAINQAVAAESRASRAEREAFAAGARRRMRDLSGGEDW
jgi:metal-responsive CopG/Arc/MetJ family transcriptional regulator